MFQIISAAIAGSALTVAYAAAWRIYRSAWERKATPALVPKPAPRAGAFILLLRRRRPMKARHSGQRGGYLAKA
ncbi:hypothetical protein MSC49_00450 [Methylosinus sp. C49]|uniref:hypothetical protein n=1 Tax=Methylosinus sp. C49 TaxID=2699395 RepID=UPI0013669387|nr:hypothetical protein [Methylosinus sp. C49]BBU60110.1 hypothetical protein MSC49_00450 [Methylosinus sp. C49]